MAIIADQITKYFAFAMKAESVDLTAFLTIQKVQNKGAAFGFLRQLENSNFILIFMSAVTIIFMTVLIKSHKKIDLLGKISFGLLLGGALSNLFDRISGGGVKDIIYLHYNRFSWPTFNLADLFICLGVLLLLISLFRHHHRETELSQGSNAGGEAT